MGDTSRKPSVNPGGGQNRARFPVWNAGALEAPGRRVARKKTPCAFLISDPVLEADTPVLFGKEFSPEDTDRIIMMAWEDRTPFEAIEAQFGLTEKDVKEFMRQVQSKKTYIRWRERVEGRITKLGKMRSKEVQRSRPVRCRCGIKKRHKSDNQKF
jgi:uncharacterized protein (TIGR03643 family)